MEFDEFFKLAKGELPFPYQKKLALLGTYPEELNVPTGGGKTASIILSWIWRRRFGAIPPPPRRLVYCLPMRVLVEQTAKDAGIWINALKSGGILKTGDIPVHILMGGEGTEDWTSHPEREAIFIGTQDMLLSRALNRGYGASRFHWPREFGLLNNDSMWVLDEIQLMGPGLATSVQLEAFRRLFGIYGRCSSIWMSATLDPLWLTTVDYKPEGEMLTLNEEDRHHEVLSRRLKARKLLSEGRASLEGTIKDYMSSLTREIVDRHIAGTLTIVVMNVVARAHGIYNSLLKEYQKKNARPDIRLIHSQFRPHERKGWEEFLDANAKVPKDGRIVVTTQVIEAGVNLSAKTLLTELAPWPSIVQRIGRCNRFGEFDVSYVVWFDIEQHSEPYSLEEIGAARTQLKALEGEDVSPEALEKVRVSTPYEPGFLLRKSDMVGLFDTAPDLSGRHVDVSRFIRQAEDIDVLIFWRKVDFEPPAETPSPNREELCPVPAYELNKFLGKRGGWKWDHLEERWRRVREGDALPGEEILLDSEWGGYRNDTGWDPRAKDEVQVLPSNRSRKEGVPSDFDSKQNYWQTLEAHSSRTAEVAESLLKALSELGLPQQDGEAVLLAARFHDLGKAHPVFQHTLLNGMTTADKERLPPNVLWAKSNSNIGRHERPYFRHELASALVLIEVSKGLGNTSSLRQNLLAYLVAAHHGKVRLTLRSLPDELQPGGGRRFALGVWDGDQMPSVSLGDGYSTPSSTVNLSVMDLGYDKEGRPSWLQRMLELRDNPSYGPFRLAYLEALVRAADVRASKDPGDKGVFR